MIDVLINDVLSTPSILIGLFVLLGNVLLNQSFAKIISGTFKTIIGFTMLSLGADIVAGALDNFSIMFTEAFGLQALVMNTDAYGALLNESYSLAPIIMVSGMLLNLVIAKYTRFKYIYLSGHLALYMSGMIAMILSDFNIILTLIIGASILALYMAISPAILQKYTTDITGIDDIAVANTGSINFYLSAKIGEFIGDKEQSTEDIKVPKNLGFLQDSAVSMSLTMSILFIFISFFTGAEFIEANLSDGQNFIFFSFMQGIIFASGVQVLLAGINMAIDELVPAFRGIANKLIEGVIPGLDAPVMAKYSPNAMIIGFLSSLTAGIIGMIFLSTIGLPMVIPGMFQHFFIGGVAATYGNSTGGRKGAIVGSFLNGLMMGVLPSIFHILVDSGVSDTIVFGDTDFTLIGIILESIVNLFN